jgi:UPF0755 protein
MTFPASDQEEQAGKATEKTVRHAFRYWAVFFVLGLPALVSLWMFVYAVLPGPGRDDTGVAVIIPRHTGVAGIEEILVTNDVIRADIRFRLLARLTGKAQVLKAGEYLFAPGLTPYQVLCLLAEGKVVQRPVTIPEGVDMKRIADILATDGWVDRDRFLALCRQRTLITDLGLHVDNLEGYLFPDTYYLSRENQDENGIIRMMVARFKKVYQEISAKVPGRQTLSQHEVVTLASIVEKETGLDQERPLVAQVYLNRLAKGMRLQADPTVLYGRAQSATGDLSRQDLATPTPYNTYVIQGLPPSPICSPGRAALMAVLQPAAGDLLYFVARHDGSHYFSKTLAEHNRAVARYRR